MKREFKVEANIGAPQVAYREAITRMVEHDYTHKKQSGGSGQFARIKFRIEPRERGASSAIKTEVPDNHLPLEYIAGVVRGVESAMSAGPLIGFPIVDLTFTLTEGAYHDVDSSALAFEIAGHSGFIEAFKAAWPVILEPIMQVEVVTSEDYVGDVIGDLNSRRGRVMGVAQSDLAITVDAMVPLANMFGYLSTLRAITRGSGRHSMSFDHYEQVPDPRGPDDRFPPAAAMRA